MILSNPDVPLLIFTISSASSKNEPKSTFKPAVSSLNKKNFKQKGSNQKTFFQNTSTKFGEQIIISKFYGILDSFPSHLKKLRSILRF